MFHWKSCLSLSSTTTAGSSLHKVLGGCTQHISHMQLHKTRQHQLMRVTNDCHQFWGLLSFKDGSPMVTALLTANCPSRPPNPKPGGPGAHWEPPGACPVTRQQGERARARGLASWRGSAEIIASTLHPQAPLPPGDVDGSIF